MSDCSGESLTFGFPFNKSTNKFPSLLKVVFVLYKLHVIVFCLTFILKMWKNSCIMLYKKCVRYIFCFLFTDFRIRLVNHVLLSCLCLLWLASLIGACLSTILFRVLIASCIFSFRFFSGLRISCQSISLISSKYRSLLNLE